MGVLKPLLLAFSATPALGRDAFVFLGATGDNALRPNGVWPGLFEAWAGAAFDDVGGVDIHVAMNIPHTVAELHTAVTGTLSPLATDLAHNSGWQCKLQGGDCSIPTFLSQVRVNIWPGRDANEQAANMTDSLKDYGRITVYLSLPPFVFGTWSTAAVKNWGEGSKERVHIAAEKPFGTSLASAEQLHKDILGPGLPEGNLHLVDHWLSFFIDRNLLELRSIALPRLAVDGKAKWDGSTFSRVVVTEYETRGLNGRGGFFDGVGQVRDMVQSHLLQVMTLALVDVHTNMTDLAKAKLDILDATSINRCLFGQYKGFLLEKKLKYHPSFADSTLVQVELSVDTPAWRGVPITIATGKDMGTTLYTLDFYGRDPTNKLTFELGREEVGVGGIKVTNWHITDTESFQAPAPGFGNTGMLTATPDVTDGNGFILDYNMPGLYFPMPYSMMVSALLSRHYGQAFVTWPECKRSWVVVTADSESECLDPPPDKVKVYSPPQDCGHTPPAVCDDNETVAFVYDVTFACTPEHNVKFANVSLYEHKCKVGAVHSKEDVVKGSVLVV